MPEVTTLAHQPDDPDSERKFVTILRADVVHSTGLISELEPEEAVSRLEPALRAMRAAVRQFGGIVSKELGDGLAAVFGAPIADDNHAPLACHAAIELVRRVEGLGDPDLKVRVGLHSGTVVAYVVASEFSKVYEIGGAAQHLAARLETEAGPGEIYVSAACRNLSEGHVQFEFVGNKPLRGFNDPIPIYRVTGALDLSSWRLRKARNVSRFVGRAAEIARLRQTAKGISAKGRTVFLTGDPGIGKSRLVHEFVQELKLAGWRTIEAECSPNLQSSPFAALRSLLDSVVSGTAPDSPAPRTNLPLLLQSAIDAVLDRPLSDPAWVSLEPAQRGRAIQDASCAVVENVARDRPTVVLIEDMQWVDRASDAVMAALASLNTPNLLIVFTSRPGGVPNWIDQRGVEKLALRALDEDASRAMLDAILGVSSTTFELKGRIIRHTASVPLFVEEVCRRLKETGVIEGEWGNLTLGQQAGDLGIPNSVQGVIASRLDRLPRNERALMQVAAVLGSRASVNTLRKVAALPEDKLRRLLDTLDRSELLVRTEVGLPHETFEFPHEMVRQVTYDQMVLRTRETMHARVLAALENDESRRDELDTLCHHARKAKFWDKTLDYARQVARKGVAQSAFADATSHFEIAMDALERTPPSHAREIDAIDLRVEARMAYMGSGKVSEWFDLSKDAERRAGAIDDLGRKVAAMAVRSAALNFYGTPVEAIETGEQVVGLAEQLDDAGWLNYAQYGLGQAYYIAGRYRASERITGRACEQLMGPEAAAPIGTTPQSMLLICCMMKSMTHVALGEIDIAAGFQQRAQQIAAESSRPFDQVAASYAAGNLALSRNHPAEAAAILDDAFALAAEHGIRIFIPVTACFRGVAYLEQGRLEDARRILADALEDARSVGYKSIELRATIHLAIALSKLGQSRDALELLRDARNTARQQGFAGIEAEALFAETIVAPSSSESDRDAVVRSLRNCIEIAALCEAAPLRLRAEARLSELS